MILDLIGLVCKFGQIVDMKLLHIGCGFPMFGAALTAAQHCKFCGKLFDKKFLHIGCGFPMFGEVLTAAQHCKVSGKLIGKKLLNIGCGFPIFVELFMLHNTVWSGAI